MRASTIIAPLFLAATSLAQGVEEGIAPAQGPPSGCEPNANGNFTIGTLKVHHASKKRESAVEAADSALVCNLSDGILRDRDGRTGSVVANHQFQFDGPPQAGAIYTGGFSICANGSLAIGGTTVWWQCNSGPFYNLYDEYIGAQCEEIRIQATFPKTTSTSSAMSSVTPSVSVSVASIQSSLATISGAVSTVSKSAVGPSASFASSNMSATSGAMSKTASATASITSGSASGSASATGAADAPPAGGAAPSSFGVAKGSMLGAFVVIFGAALIL